MQRYSAAQLIIKTASVRFNGTVLIFTLQNGYKCSREHTEKIGENFPLLKESSIRGLNALNLYSLERHRTRENVIGGYRRITGINNILIGCWGHLIKKKIERMNLKWINSGLEKINENPGLEVMMQTSVTLTTYLQK